MTIKTDVPATVRNFLLERSKQKAKYALMIDPLTAAVCSPEEIDRLFEEMWSAERESLPAFD